MDNGASSYRRFLDGDDSAFDEIMREYRNGLTFFIQRYVKEEAAAEDIAIDVFVDLIVNRRRYNFKTSLKTYLYMLGRSKALDYLRHKNRLHIVEYSQELEEPGYEPLLEEIILKNEKQRIVNEALKKLPDDMQAAVHLVYFEELSYDEAANIMRLNRKKIDNLLYRAKGTLRTIIGKEGELLS